MSILSRKIRREAIKKNPIAENPATTEGVNYSAFRVITDKP